MPSNRYKIIVLVFGCILLSVSMVTATTLQDVASQGNEFISMQQIIDQRNIATWHGSGYSGQNLKIGIIDVGFDGYATFNSVRVTNIDGDDIQYETNSGTKALEAIASIAPAAQYYLCSYTDLRAYTACVTWMIEQDVDIINHPIVFPIEASRYYLGECRG